MRNSHCWKPTKVGQGSNNRLQVPANPRELAPGSVLMATLIARWHASILPKYARGRLLDLGCGRMPYYALYREHVKSVVCTDWPYSVHGLRYVDFTADLNDGIPVKTTTIDTVLASDLLEHIYQPHELLVEISRVLRPGGTAILNMPFMYWIHEAPSDFYRFTPHAVQRMAEDAGLKCLRVDSIGSACCVLADVTGKLVQSLPYIGKHLALMVQRLVLRFAQPIPRSSVHPLAVMAILTKPTGTG